MARGTLRVYLGAAPGVGKTYAMLNEGRRRRDRGTDVVVAWVDTHGRPQTASQLGDLEVVAPRTLEHRGRQFPEMDLDAVAARGPAVALVDEMAHTNVPGSRHAKRWQDIETLLDSGIEVVTTVNIQHLESLNDVVAAITGVLQRETVPDAVVRSAEQVELVDMTPEALRRRMAHGNIYPAERVGIALANYFRPGNLAALRELALLWLADQVEERLQEYRHRHGIDGPWETRERVLVALSGAPEGEYLIRRAARMARRAKGDLIGVHIRSDEGLRQAPSPHLEEQRALLSELGGAYRDVVGTSVAKALVQVARAENATQVVLGTSRRSRWARLSRGSVINAVIAEAGAGIDVHVISPPGHQPDEPEEGQGRSRRRRARWRQLVGRSRTSSLSWRRRLGGVALAAVVLPLATLGLTSQGLHLALGTVSLIYLVPVVAVAMVGGTAPAGLAAVAAFLLLNWYFSPPVHTFTIGDSQGVVALAVFLVVAGAVSALVDLAGRRSTDAYRARAQATTLARSSAALVERDDPVPELVRQLQVLFALDGVSVLRPAEGSWVSEAGAGALPPATPEAASISLPLGSGKVLALGQPQLRAEEREVLTTFASQLAVALDHRALRGEAASAASLAKANEVRTALLAAVSHDLRTPLASIKAAVSNLLSDDIAWDQGVARALLETVEGETDRLTSLVGNLLDMSRLQTGSVAVHPVAVGLDEVVATALTVLAPTATKLEVDVAEDLPAVLADPPLLERALANLFANAVRFSAPGGVVRIVAGQAPEGMELRVVDRGAGIGQDDVERVFLPFQRLGDQDPGGGVGLGLAVARGFVAAMNGELDVEASPGGGATMVVRLPLATSVSGATNAGSSRLGGVAPPAHLAGSWG